MCRGDHRRASWVGAEFSHSKCTAMRSVPFAIVSFVLVALLVLVCTPANAQVIYGAIVGTVSDSSGG